MGQGKAELKRLHDAIRKRRAQLDNLDKDLDKMISKKRIALKVIARILFSAPADCHRLWEKDLPLDDTN